LPAALLVQEAGGMVTDTKGEKIGIKSTSALATNGKLHKKIIALLKDI
jgi:fructose-1,6-bisphosphatase/inositol monophosphatase family enzyme